MLWWWWWCRNTGGAVDMGFMFNGCQWTGVGQIEYCRSVAFNQNIGSWNVGKNKNFRAMFAGAPSFTR